MSIYCLVFKPKNHVLQLSCSVYIIDLKNKTKTYSYSFCLIDLAALLEDGETLEHLMNLSPEELLLRFAFLLFILSAFFSSLVYQSY